MPILLRSVLMLLFLAGATCASAARREWRVVRVHPDLKISICYPTDLLHVHHDEHEWANIELINADAIVSFGASPDKYTDLQKELRYSLGEALNPPPMLHGTDAQGHIFVADRTDKPFRIKTSIVKRDWYLYVAENDKSVLIDWNIHIDKAIKGILISYPKSQAAAWKGVPERMRACFTSLGPITNPMLR